MSQPDRSGDPVEVLAGRYLTLRVPTVDEVAAWTNGWDALDITDPAHRLSIAAYEAPQLVIVPTWEELGFARAHGYKGWVRSSTGFGVEAESSPKATFEPGGPWECYVVGDDSEVEVVPSEQDARWWFAVVIALDHFAEVPA